jgi:hypothetical protein
MTIIILSNDELYLEAGADLTIFHPYAKFNLPLQSRKNKFYVIKYT